MAVPWIHGSELRYKQTISLSDGYFAGGSR